MGNNKQFTLSLFRDILNRVYIYTRQKKNKAAIIVPINRAFSGSVLNFNGRFRRNSSPLKRVILFSSDGDGLHVTCARMALFLSFLTAFIDHSVH